MSTGRDIASVAKQAQRMQQQITRLQADLAERQIEAAVGGGAVVATVNGANRLVRLDIDPELLDPADVATLQELVVSAVNMALESSHQMMQDEVNRITGGINIPGLL